VDPHCFDVDPELDPDPAKNLEADPYPDPDPDPDPNLGGGVGQPKMCIPPGKILGTPLPTVLNKLISAAYGWALLNPQKKEHQPREGDLFPFAFRNLVSL
jgi:hypothetical protein